ncbi:cupin domain-containing protein [Ottowia thiooxydans]|uniref:Cupin superfamily protein n=1 Tax=Ottowia thiooxydans TaxID=219182 RepID=A0ABV2Q2B0_9BURK
MSIQHVSNTVTRTLKSIGPVGVPLSEPACQLTGEDFKIPGKEATSTGIWECSPGRFQRQVVAGEFMHFLAGRCTFTPDDGPSITIAAGDTLFFSPNTTGIWDIQETVRKVYVLL